MSGLAVLAVAALAAWVYLLLGRGFFWLPSFLPPAPLPRRWPRVVAVVPARNEAAVIGEAVASLLAQDYPGGLEVVVVDDHSSDATADAARAAARAAGAADRLAVLQARALPPGWTGKLWALSEGVRAVEARGAPPDLYLFTDADIAHGRGSLAGLVRTLEARGAALVSLMVRLRCESLAERFLIPAFVFFFAMLYPFAWAGDPRRRTAAAAGGCILLRRDAYHRAGGYEAIRGELIDDCALAGRVKAHGRIALALARDTRSLRPYPRLRDIWAMVARTAYTQLGHSPARLAGTVLGLGLTFVAPPVLVFAGASGAWLAGGAWAAMAVAYAPMLAFYGRSPLWAPALPLVALTYLAATLDSARRHRAGRGGEWKGRVQWQSQR
ncbi:MAG TPA: glycosyltransferase [Stellaceae bacterium]|nr:glycosyltransferase [Stellaceae bacterium]